MAHIVQECLRLGQNDKVLQLCRRVGAERLASEQWWPLLAVLDRAAATAAVPLDKLDVAITHTLWALHPRAQGPPRERKQMAQRLLTLINQPRLVSPNLTALTQALHFGCPADSSGLVRIQFRFHSERLAPGSRFRGSVELCSRLPIAISFVQLSVSFNLERLDRTVTDKARLLLTPDKSCTFAFEWTAPEEEGTILICEDVQLQLGHMPSAVLFYAEQPEQRALVCAPPPPEPPAPKAPRYMPAEQWAAQLVARFMPSVEAPQAPHITEDMRELDLSHADLRVDKLITNMPPNLFHPHPWRTRRQQPSPIDQPVGLWIAANECRWQ